MLLWGTTSACAENTLTALKIVQKGGTTSACAENTQTQLRIALLLRNYLRVRGEYNELDDFYRNGLELPPRARRILANGHNRGLIGGTTSACAENTLNELGLL